MEGSSSSNNVSEEIEYLESYNINNKSDNLNSFRKSPSLIAANKYTSNQIVLKFNIRQYQKIIYLTK